MTFIRLMGPVLLSAALCGMMFLIRIDDAPDGGRKVQKAPVPSSGGVAILIALGVSAWLASEAGLLSDYWLHNGTQTVLAITMAAGAIGFVGLFIPHILRFLTRADEAWLIPFSALGGASFLILIDSFIRATSGPGTPLYLGIVTSLIGVPFFLWLAWRQS